LIRGSIIRAKKRVSTENEHSWIYMIIAILCIYASLAPVRADVYMSGDLHLEFYWTQLHKLHCGISWQNAEILFPLGGFALLFVGICSMVPLAIKSSTCSAFLLTLCLVLHVLLRGLVDYYLITTYWPFIKSRFYWDHVGVGWWFLAFTGGIASVTAMGLQFCALITSKRRRLDKKQRESED